MPFSYSGKGRSVFAVIRDKLGQNCLSVSFICFELLSGLCCGYGWPNQNFWFGTMLWLTVHRLMLFYLFSGIICDCFLYILSWYLFSVSLPLLWLCGGSFSVCSQSPFSHPDVSYPLLSIALFPVSAMHLGNQKDMDSDPDDEVIVLSPQFHVVCWWFICFSFLGDCPVKPHIVQLLPVMGLFVWFNKFALA